MTEDQPHRVVVIGGGFGGLQAVHGLRRANVEVTLIDRRNFHLFQPLSYQVATGALSSAEVCFPQRWIFRRRKDVRVLMAEGMDFDLDRRAVRVQPLAGENEPILIDYDTLIVAGGLVLRLFRSR
jgi:NADH dehydrogenase